ncbi:MAG: hypothetical protein H8E47_07310 [Anaerolineales bacterium]|nr:hypothetical protein [Anaerolineales bacterium]
MFRTIVSIHLFLKPSWEMDIEDIDYIDPEILRQKGDELRERLHAAAEIVGKLQSDGWPRVSGQAAIYDLEFIWGGDSKSAKERLVELGIDPDEVSIEEVEEWE